MACSRFVPLCGLCISDYFASLSHLLVIVALNSFGFSFGLKKIKIAAFQMVQ